MNDAGKPPPPALRGKTAARGRQDAQRRGHRAETVAAWRLRLAGYSILARNYRTPVGEIDIVARRWNTIVFVEVKTRDSFDTAAEAVAVRQRDRIYRAAEVFLAGRPDLSDCDVRFDAIFVVRGRLPRHLRDTWREPT